ncbi:MAG: hypothetical protein ACK4Z6_04525, partial [Candidatus Methylomirabilales bacterium]
LENLETKRRWQRWALEHNALLMFEHDVHTPMGRLVEREGKLYCCDGCAQGSPCLCRQLQAERLLSLEGGG